MSLNAGNISFKVRNIRIYKIFTFKGGILFMIAAMMLVMMVCCLIILGFMIKHIKTIIIKLIIKRRMKNEQYFLNYQPIYTPKTMEIVGFEALLRLRGKNKEIILPNKFIPQIEKNNMLLDVSIWIIKKVIKEYQEIRNFRCVEGKNFYISLNISLKELENDYFIKRATKLLAESNLKQRTICLEIVEKVKMNDVDKITKNISHLKKVGFKIAIDDFGVEYSNLDILHKLDFDTIKIDKHFIDGIDKDIIKKEIILFISRIAKFKNKSVVLEGIEEPNQDLRIKEIKHPSLYVQGYYYNKPMNIEDLKNM